MSFSYDLFFFHRKEDLGLYMHENFLVPYMSPGLKLNRPSFSSFFFFILDNILIIITAGSQKVPSIFELFIYQITNRTNNI